MPAGLIETRAHSVIWHIEFASTAQWLEVSGTLYLKLEGSYQIQYKTLYQRTLTYFPLSTS